MRKIIYRRDNISTAFNNGDELYGCNLWVWYGYQNDSNPNADMIIDAGIIKNDMKEDLSLFDHTCITVQKGIDIIDSIIELGNQIYSNAQKRHLFSELLIEDIYGDVITFNHTCISIDKQAFLDLESRNVIYNCNDADKLIMYSQNVKPIVITSDKNYTSQQLSRLQKNGLITLLNTSTGIHLSYSAEKMSPKYYTFICIEPIAHLLSNLPETEKCSHLHGHTYKCRIVIENKTDKEIEACEIIQIGTEIRCLLKQAFTSNKLLVTTTENVIDYISNHLNSKFNLAFAELAETPNIKVRLYY